MRFQNGEIGEDDCERGFQLMRGILYKALLLRKGVFDRAEAHPGQKEAEPEDQEAREQKNAAEFRGKAEQRGIQIVKRGDEENALSALPALQIVIG